MRSKHRSLLASAGLFGPLVCAALSAPAQAATLTGQVTSAEEGSMEGVVVSARKQGSTITLSVVTDQKGQYSFPRGSARRRSVCDRHPGGGLQS